MPKFEVQVNRCTVCEKTVYPMEQLLADEVYYHKACFKCTQCKRTLSTGTYASLEGAIYCKPHFLQLFKQKGNYEEGFGKQRHKNRWGPGGKQPETTTNGKADAIEVETEEAVEAETAEKENSVPIVKNGTSEPHEEDSTDGGVEEERTPISLEYKKGRLQQAATDKSKQSQQPNTVGKLGKWQPVQRGTSQDGTHKTAPKKLNNTWADKMSNSREMKKFEEPAWVALAKARFERGPKFQEITSFKTKFESGDVGQKEFKSEVRDEIDRVREEMPGTAIATKSMFEAGEYEKKEYKPETRLEVETLIKAGKQAALEKKDQFEHQDNNRSYDSQARHDAEIIARVLPGAATDKKNKFESGELITTKFESDTRKELEEFRPTSTASERKNQFENDEVEHVEYESEVRKEIEDFKNVRTASTKKEIYESGHIDREEVEILARKEIESLHGTGSATSAKSKFEKGEYERVQIVSPVKQEIEQMKSSIDNSNKRSKYEAGELDEKDYESDVRKELQTMKTGASDLRTKYESGELTQQEYESEVKKELEGLKTGASDIKSRIETGDVERPEYEESQAKRDLEHVKRNAPGSSSVKNKYLQEVHEGNRVVTSKPVEIEKVDPEDRVADTTYEEVRKVEEADDVELVDEGEEYVAPPQPKKMTNIMERFKKPEQEKETPMINKIKIPSFEKKADSDEEEKINGDNVSDAEAAGMRDQLWSKKTSNLKDMFESKNSIDNEPKSTPQPIDLEAEINAYQDHLKKNRPSKKPKPSKRRSTAASENSDSMPQGGSDVSSASPHSNGVAQACV